MECQGAGHKHAARGIDSCSGVSSKNVVNLSETYSILLYQMMLVMSMNSQFILVGSTFRH